MKIIKDDKIDQLFEVNKDYEIKSSISDIYEKLSIKETTKVFENNRKIPKKPLILGSIIGSLSGLVIAGTAIFTVVTTQNNTISRKNISSSATYFNDSEKCGAFGKELLLFQMTKNSGKLGLRNLEQQAFNLIDSESLIQNSMFGHIAAGFENIAPIIFNQISSFDSMISTVKKLSTPTIITNARFSNCYVSTYNSLKFKYFFNDDGSTNYGVSQIGDEYFTTYIYEVANKKNCTTEIYLEGIDNSTYFKISENPGVNCFTYKEFKNKQELKNDVYSFNYNVDLGDGKEASSFSIKSYNKYEITYNDITLKDLLKILFNVNYYNINTNEKFNYIDCYCSSTSNAGRTEYKIGNNQIIL